MTGIPAAVAMRSVEDVGDFFFVAASPSGTAVDILLSTTAKYGGPEKNKWVTVDMATKAEEEEEEEAVAVETEQEGGRLTKELVRMTAT